MMRLPALLTLGLLAALSWTLTQGQTCQLVEISNSKGDDNAISRVESIGFEDCKTLCLSLDTCKALEQRSATTCILFSSDTAFPSSGDTLLQKVCTVAPACTLSNTADLDGDSPAVTLALSIEDSCKKVCNSIAECMAFVFRSSPAECKLLESVPTTTATVGSVYSKKIQSGSGPSCEFERSENMDVPSSASSTSLTNSARSCAELCLAISNCLAVSYNPNGGLCKLFTSTPMTTASSGVTLYEKSCSSSDTATFTTTDVCNDSAPACTLSNTADLDGDSPAVTLALSIEDSCKKVCNSIAECMAFVFRSSPAECKLLESVPTTTATVGSVYSKKIQSGSGPSCEFERSENMDVPSSASSTSLTNSARSCAELCLAISNCLAVSYNPNGGLCKLFTSTPMTTASSGVTLYEKSCSSSDTATFTTTDVCNDSGSKTTPHPTFLVSVIVLTLILS
ncbi:putative GPI-anchored protein pfl2 [Aplysia californica]|uniref:GPI-anchored protein pfl2 n=1 Tax=Aplysia californica TaxID=6500 RepID=A0ABM1AA05_APLCA|nr:putative GPI-anchored protein pfl2 [Aplysia californica]